MALSLAQLLSVPNLDGWRANVFSVLGGRGLVIQTGIGAGGVGLGTGSVAVSGIPNGNYAVVILVSTTGEPGIAQVQVSTDGGATFSAATTIPSNGSAVALGSTGASATFTAGPAGGGTSFVATDRFSIGLTSPSFLTAQQPGSAGRDLAETQANASLDLHTLIAAIAAGGYATLATGSWADLIGLNVYGLPRKQAVTTTGTVTLTDTASAGPFTIASSDGRMVGTNGGLRYTVIFGGTLTKGGSLAVSIQAESPGSAYNVGPGAITNMVAGVLAGVTVNNGSTWLTTQGVDAELDGPYMARCMGQWAALGVGAPAALYIAKSLNAVPSVTRVVAFPDPTVPGQVDVYCAGPGGGSLPGDVTTVGTTLQPFIPLTSTLSTNAATNVPIPITGTIFYSGTTLATVTAAVNAALNSYIEGVGLGLPAASEACTVYAGKIEAAVDDCVGVDDYSFSGLANVVLTFGQVAVPGTYTLTFTAVT